MARALVLYTTKTGNTKKIADFVAEGLRFSGATAEVKTIDQIADPAQLEEYDALILGSPTYGAQMMGEMKEFLEVMSSCKLSGKPGGAFGAFGWSGEAPDEIYDYLKKECGMDMAGDALRLKAADIEGGMKMAQGYGREIGDKIAG